MTMEVDGEMQPQAKELQQPQEAGRGKRIPPRRATGGNAALSYLDLGLLPPDLGEKGTKMDFPVETPDQHPGQEMRVNVSLEKPRDQQRP